MPLLRNFTVGMKQGLPRELQGLQNFTFFNGHMFGETTNKIFWDVCHVRGPIAGAGGYFIVAGIGIAGSSTKRVLIMKENGPVRYFDTGDGGSASPFTGAASVPDATSEGGKAVFLGAASGTVTRLDMAGGNMLVAGSGAWAQNGSWSSNTPVASWPHTVHTNITPGGDWIAMGKAAAAPGSTKRMSKKSRTDTSFTAWTTITVPDVGANEGYVKGRVSNGGYIMALSGIGAGAAQTFTVDISNSGGGVTSMTTDGTLGGENFDMDYSPNADKFILVDGTDTIQLCDGGWAPGGPVGKVAHVIPNLANSVGAQQCVAMDVPSRFVPTGEQNIRSATWYGFMVTSQGAFFPFENAFFVTKDFVNWFSVDLPGGHLGEYTGPGLLFPTMPVLKFCHNRLFVFTQLGMSVSGPLGEVAVTRS